MKDRARPHFHALLNSNLLLTKHEGRIGEYWPEVLAVSTDRARRGPYKKRPRANIPQYSLS